MDINQCPNCQKQFDQDKRVAKQLPCGCVSCLQCYKIIFQFTQEIKCKYHQRIYNINPEQLQEFVVQEQVQQQVPHIQEQFIDQEQIAQQLRFMQDQYVQTQKDYRMIREVVKDNAYFMKHIQSVFVETIFKCLLDKVSMSNVKIESLLKRLAELQAVSEVQQQQQALILGQQDPRLSQNPQVQQQQQFQQILREIDELKKNSLMDIQSLRVNVQRCMFNMFVYLNENFSGQLLEVNEADLLIQKYFKQFKVIRGLSQESGSIIHQKSQFQSQSIEQQLIKESQNNDYHQQNQILDKQEQDLFLFKQVSIPQELSIQEQQVIDARVLFQQLEQKLVNIKNDFSFVNQIEQLCQEQKILDLILIPPVDLTFDNLVQFLTQIKNENMSLQVLQSCPLNNSRLTEQSQILLKLSEVTDQQISSQLIQMIQQSKSQFQLQQVAANAITILNFMNYTFNNQDLSDLDLSNSDLSDTTFTDCNFANSNLTQANLRNSKFISCDLSNANLTSIITEHPHIYSGHTSIVYAVAISRDSEFIVSGSLDSTIILWDVKTGTSKTMSGHKDSVTAVAISRDSEFIVSGSGDRTIILWNVKTGTSKTMSGHTGSVFAVAISRDSEFIVSGSADCTIILWDIKTGASKTMSGHKDCVLSVAISTDSEFIVSGSVDCTIRLWNTRTQECIKVLKGHTDWVFSVSISNNQQYIVSGSGDETIILWSIKSQECIKVLNGHSGPVYSVIFSFDDKYIISGSLDETIRVWSVQSGEQLCEINNCGYVGSLSISEDNNWLVSSTGH